MTDNGYILLLVLLILTLLLSLGMFMVDHFMIRQRVVHNLYMELKTYYLAEGGIEYAASRLTLDPFWRTAGLVLNLNKEGQIYLTVLTEAEYIHVQVTGSVQQYQRSEDAYFTSFPPITRTK